MILSIKSFFLWTPFSQIDFERGKQPLRLSEEWELPVSDIIDKKKQRRLNELSKIVLHSATKCITSENKNFVTVLSSRNGDINNALKILQDIKAGELISPQMFVNSVLNMPYAYYSIFFNNNLPSSAISSSESSLCYGFLEAAMNLNRFPGKDVLLTCADLPLDNDLKCYNDTSYLPYSLSLIISKEKSDQNMISFDYESFKGTKNQNRIPDALDFYYHFLSDNNVFFASETSDSRFIWKKHST